MLEQSSMCFIIKIEIVIDKCANAIYIKVSYK